jgi:predicted nucleic acid-binding protein
MLVASNTSPISNLAIVNRLELLMRRYGEVRIPPAVALELSHLSHKAGRLRIADALSNGWLIVDSTTVHPPNAFDLDAGESAAICLALAIKADILLIDEKRGRVAARSAGLSVAGILGELLHARLNGKILKLSDELARLRTEAGFFIGSDIERFILSQAGE